MASSVSSFAPNETRTAVRQRLLQEKQRIIVEMNDALRAVTTIPVPAPTASNGNERQNIRDKNYQEQLATQEQFLKKLDAWHSKLSPEEQAALTPTDEEEARAFERAQEYLDGEECCC